MYSMVNEANRRSPVQRSPIDEALARAADREVLPTAVELTGKHAVSSKLNMRNATGADMYRQGELKHLRTQLAGLPEQVREHARITYQHEQDRKRRELQDFQCMQICHLHRVLMRNFVAQGSDPKTYRIGGNDRRTYGAWLFLANNVRLFSLRHTLILVSPPSRALLQDRAQHAHVQAAVHHRDAALFR